MSSTIRKRILDVYRGQTPDLVPCMLDLSHWFYHKNGLPWDIGKPPEDPECELIDCHKKMGVGFYVPIATTFQSVQYAEGVEASVRKESEADRTRITWTYSTPIGCIERTRVWEPITYAWGVPDWSIKTEQDLRTLGYAMSHRTFVPHWDRYRAWLDYVGDAGVVYAPFGYSAIGYLLNYWMGIEATMYAAVDWADTLHEVVDQINENSLECIRLLAESPAEVVMMGDNISSDVQPPHFFNEWSRPFYAEAIRILHDAGKYVAVHIDGKLRGAIGMIRDVGADCSDATTPVPMGDLTPEECREEAGPDFILSGGVSPDLWLPNADVRDFKEAVKRWLGLKRYSPRLIASAGDQVPPGTEEDRIELLRDLVEECGRY